MASFAELLVRDRFQEFQRLVQSKHPGLAPATAATANGKAAGPNKAFMRQFFESVSDIQGWLNEGRQKVELMGGVLEEALQATTQEKQKDVSDRLQALVQETNQHISSIKHGLEKLKSEEVKPGSAESKIRANMQQALVKKHQQLLLDFQRAQVDFKQVLERRQLREMEILMPDATAQQRQEMIEAGETTALIMAKRMAGTHALLLDEVQRIRDKHQDILRLEQSIADLAQMFQEMAVLVDSQGEMLDSIEHHIHKTKDYTAKAEEQLIGARKAQMSGQKWLCCLTVFVMIVVLCIVGPLLLKAHPVSVR